jgi:hypothetical protein
MLFFSAGRTLSSDLLPGADVRLPMRAVAGDPTSLPLSRLAHFGWVRSTCWAANVRSARGPAGEHVGCAAYVVLHGSSNQGGGAVGTQSHRVAKRVFGSAVAGDHLVGLALRAARVGEHVGRALIILLANRLAVCADQGGGAVGAQCHGDAEVIAGVPVAGGQLTLLAPTTARAGKYVDCALTFVVVNRLLVSAYQRAGLRNSPWASRIMGGNLL